MKNILLDLERLRYPNSGIAKVFANLACGLQNLEKEHKICLFGPKSEIEKNKINLKVIEKKAIHKFYENFSSSYQLIHISHQLSPFFSKNYKKTVKIVTLHDLNFLHENLTEKKREKMLNKVRKCLRYADYIVCISHFVKADFLKNKDLFHLKKIKDVFVVHNGIVFPMEKEYGLESFPELKNKNYLLNIGVFFNKKNQLALVKALKYTNFDLVLISSDSKGNYEDTIMNEIHKNGLTDRVHIYKNISEENKNTLLYNCKALCHPSIAEGFGMPPVEAMGFGKPVFLSKFTSLPEIGGNVAFYFNDFEPETMAETIKNGISEYNTNPDMKNDIKNWAKQFDYKVMAKNYMNLYEEILR